MTGFHDSEILRMAQETKRTDFWNSYKLIKFVCPEKWRRVKVWFQLNPHYQKWLTKHQSQAPTHTPLGQMNLF